MEPSLDKFKNVPGTVSKIEQEIGVLLELQSKGDLFTSEAVEKLEKYKTNPTFKDEYDNAVKTAEFGTLPEAKRVELVREDIDKNIDIRNAA